MRNDLKLFITITNHLISLTGYDEYGYKKSRGIETFESFAEELNDQNIATIQGNKWTKNNLTLFLFRIKKRYSIDELVEHCDLHLIGSTCLERLTGERSQIRYLNKATFSEE